MSESAVTARGRNAPCYCGSGRKYKHCCLQTGGKARERLAAEYRRRHGIRLKAPEDIEGIRRAGALVIRTLAKVAESLRPGMTTEAINTLVHEYTLEQGAVPAPLGYRGFPKSVCTSVNEVICHGIPGPRALCAGDIINVDVTTLLEGYYADANQTYFIGEPGRDARHIVTVARDSLLAGLDQVRPGATLGDIGGAIQALAEAAGCSVVREFIGHGTGFDFHEPPDVMHYGRRGEGLRLVPGMVFTVEPMINLGARHMRVLADHWTAITRDGSLSAQFEQTVAVTETGFESLTPF